MVATAPWRPPDLGDIPDLDLWNAMVSHLGVPLTLRAPAVAVVSAGAEPAPDASAALVRFGRGACFVAAPAAFPFAALLGADLGIADLALLPPVLSEALLDGVEASLIAALPTHRDGPAAVAARAPWAALDLGGLDRARLRWFRAELTGLAPEPALVDLGLDPAHVGALLSPALGARRLWGGLEARLTRPADDTLGRLVLPASRLSALGPGAVAVLDRTFDPDRRRLRVGSAGFDFVRQGENWLCAGAEALELFSDRTAMPPDDASPAATGLDTGSIAVAVDFDLGRLDVPLAALESWRPGSVVALPPHVLADGVAVTLRINGRPVGTGDLVQIDGRIAVRLTDVRLG